MSARSTIPLALAVAALGSLPATTGCASARARVDPALAASAEEWSVAGPNPRPGRALVTRGTADAGAIASASVALLLFQPPDERGGREREP